MSRVREQNEQQKAATRQKILETALRLFSEKTIDAVNLTEIAEAAGVGIMTVYRHFDKKPDLVLEVNAWAWDRYWQENKMKAFSADLTAAEWFDRYLSAFIDLFLHHRDILRYNQYFNAYIQREGIPHDRMQSFSQVIDVIRAGFRRIYQRARKDGTLRTDVPENEMFSASLHLMLAAVTRYAVGLVYDAGIPPEQELLLLKNMLMREYVIQE